MIFKNDTMNHHCNRRIMNNLVLLDGYNICNQKDRQTDRQREREREVRYLMILSTSEVT